MKSGEDSKGPYIMTRRQFLLATAAASAGMGFAVPAAAEEQATTASVAGAKASSPDDLNVAIIGVGTQGRVLMESCLKIPGIRFVAVCDIWNYSQQYTQRYLKKYGHDVRAYEDYKEMLDKEKDIQAVLIASPDWMHAPHTIACLEKGHHVYCEKEMSNTLQGARSIVEAARKSGKVVQIGHQRRSNPRYQHAVNNLMHEANLLGRITHANAQWNRSKSEDLGWPDKYEIPAATLQKYGYESMMQLRNWRWFKKYGGGPIVDLGSHQIDVFNWVFGCSPSSVMAGGGVDFYKTHEWYDNVMAIFEYPTKQGTARAFYQVLTTTRHGQFYETFMGENGSIAISEVPPRGNTAWRESHAPEWEPFVEKGWLKSPTPLAPVAKDVAVDSRVSADVPGWMLPVELAKPAHQPHLENFFDAIRKGTPLNCPVDAGYECAATVLKVNEAVAAAKKLQYDAAEFKV